MNFLEKDLEQIIWESDNEKLEQKGLLIDGKKYRQLKIGGFGIADLVTVKKQYYYNRELEKYIPFLAITVFELKKEKVGISAFLQAVRYCKGIKTYLEDKYFDLEFTFDIFLVSKEVDKVSDFIFLTDLFKSYKNFGYINNIKYYSFSYDIDGIRFKNEELYNLVHKGF